MEKKYLKSTIYVDHKYIVDQIMKTNFGIDKIVYEATNEEFLKNNPKYKICVRYVYYTNIDKHFIKLMMNVMMKIFQAKAYIHDKFERKS